VRGGVGGGGGVCVSSQCLVPATRCVCAGGRADVLMYVCGASA
jgi:hypothetical protein